MHSLLIIAPHFDKHDLHVISSQVLHLGQVVQTVFGIRSISDSKLLPYQKTFDYIEFRLSSQHACWINDLEQSNFYDHLTRLLPHKELSVFFNNDRLHYSCYRMLFMDMDSTLIQGELMDHFAAHLGIESKISTITQHAMEGKIDFNDSFRLRLKLLSGLPIKVIESITKQAVVTEGAKLLINKFKAVNGIVVLISGGLDICANWFKLSLGIQHVVANRVLIVNGCLTDQITMPIIDGAQKEKFLFKLSSQYDIHMEQTIAIGDGSNDIPMLKSAGLGIAFSAKPNVKALIKKQLNGVGMDALLLLLQFDR